ncbi:condensation protein [Streptomyces sp. NBC_00620]|uniref:condensation protein n=1 Tax=Streptomyces sp. NBC_00620 TaxID=2903666 RepID=UPI00225A0ED5|nr:condensation protein [Streptomyces sp. NBC_00620]MCX4974784.1 condensation protein [Streptomyces sp. NBC_00620]
MTAVEHPARNGAGGPVGPPARVPFPVVDEVSRHCLQEAEPETVHIEVHLPGRLDHARLRSVFTEALRRHPRILMREAPGPWYRRRYEWELTDGPDVEVVTFPPPDRDALKHARDRALDVAPPLSAAPPVRLEVVDEDGASEGTVLFLTMNHTALDGPACLRILATAAELYGGRDNSPAAPPVRTPGAPEAQRVDTPSSWAPPARVAHGTPEPSPGNGLLVTELNVPRRPKGSPYTVNDQLMVTTALMLAHWNREHGARPRPLRITMPVDDRSRDMDMPIGNGTRLVEVTFAPEELRLPEKTDPARMGELLRRTALRTQALKSVDRPQLGHGAALLTAPVVPVAWRAALTRGLRRAAGPWTSTTLLSNIGRIPYPLDFGEAAGRANAVWFSAPARMPRGLTVTTASTAGRLHVALRWSRTLLSHGDGAHLRDLFEHYLHATEENGP